MLKLPGAQDKGEEPSGKKTLAIAREENKPASFVANKKSPKEPMSKPLPLTKWAALFGVSRSTMGRWKKSGPYPFQQVSARKWTLPLSKLPAEYLQKYQQNTKKA